MNEMVGSRSRGGEGGSGPCEDRTVIEAKEKDLNPDQYLSLSGRKKELNTRRFPERATDEDRGKRRESGARERGRGRG